MKMNKYVKIALFGAIIWIAAFIAGAFLYTPEGKPKLELLLIQNIFFIIIAAATMILLWVHFKNFSGHYLREGIAIGVIWFVVNSLLDFAILLPAFGVSFDAWLVNIMPSLLVLPILSIGASLIAKQRPQQLP